MPFITNSSKNQFTNQVTDDSNQLKYLQLARNDLAYQKTERNSVPFIDITANESDATTKEVFSSNDHFINDQQDKNVRNDITPDRKKQKFDCSSIDSEENNLDEFTLKITYDDTEPHSSPADIIPTSSIENIGPVNCVICKKKVIFKNKFKHAIKHYPDFLPEESLQRSPDIFSVFICSYNYCKFRCSKAQIMQEHYASAHGELEKYLNKTGKKLSDIYLTKTSKASLPKKRRISNDTSDNAQEQNSLKTIESQNVVNLDDFEESSIDDSSQEILPSDIRHEKEPTNIDLNETEEGAINVLENKTKDTPSSMINSGYSPISSDGFSDEEPKASIEPNLDKYVQISYPEIDTEAETDHEDII